MEITKMLTLSTAHLPADEKEAADYICCMENEYAWLIWCAGEFPFRKPSPKLDAVIAFARAQGCDWLRLDADGPVVPELPVFEWTP